MAEESAKLRIPYIAAAQAQKHVTHNEAMTLLDTLVQLSVIDKDLTEPPAEPGEGDCYIVAAGASGGWLGWDNRVARYIDGEWRSYLPGEGAGAGWLAWVLDEDAMYRFDGAAWTPAGIEGPEGPQGPAGANGQSFQPDAVAALIAGRDVYDDEAAAFSVLVVADSTNDDQPTVYFKLSAMSADWSDPITWLPSGGGGGTAAASENAFINGGFDIWQESTDVTTITTSTAYAGADGFYAVTGAGTLAHIQRSTTVRAGARTEYCMQLDGASGVTTVNVGQVIEAVDIPRLKRTVTFSAWLYNGSGAAFTPKIYLRTPSASDNWASSAIRNGGGSGEDLQECADGEWTQVRWSADISGYANIDNGLAVEMQIPSGSLIAGDLVRLAEWQLVEGDIESPVFETLPFQRTRERCFWRYKRYVATGTGQRLANGVVNTSTISIIIMTGFSMRATPSIDYSNLTIGVVGAALTVSSVNSVELYVDALYVTLNHSSTGAGAVSQLRLPSASDYIAMDARLKR